MTPSNDNKLFIPRLKAHPQDQPEKDVIKYIFQIVEQLKQSIQIVYLEKYDIEMAQKLTSGVDI